MKVNIEISVNDKILELSDDNDNEQGGGYDVLREGELVLSTYESGSQSFRRCREILEEELTSLLDEVQSAISGAEWEKGQQELRARYAQKAADPFAPAAAKGEKGQALPPEEEFP
jgi:hypothetical protein